MAKHGGMHHEMHKGKDHKGGLKAAHHGSLKVMGANLGMGKDEGHIKVRAHKRGARKKV